MSIAILSLPKILFIVQKPIKNYFYWALDIILPPRCTLCDQRVLDQHVLCSDCFDSLKFITDPCCVCCGYPFELASDSYAPDKTKCAKCLEKTPSFSHLRSCLVYSTHSKKLVLGFKHGDKTYMAKLIGRLLYQSGQTMFKAHQVIVPVPLHSSKLRKRKYNQAGLMAQALSYYTGLSCHHNVLFRCKKTLPQGHLTSTKRHENVKKAFDVKNKADVKNKSILLIDDVYTTGATIHECVKILKRAGAKEIDVLTLARVVH